MYSVAECLIYWSAYTVLAGCALQRSETPSKAEGQARWLHACMMQIKDLTFSLGEVFIRNDTFDVCWRAR